ncbi:glycosyltransferase family 1 protein [Trichoderma atroviride IMI 206040]|uniref:Glycosyltransferase family 1 protein n=1 Tax=Hypocrea atroviridis (strain ATCC 20476 / IMI 206040) TaxID=452589 RepID=G9P2F6_HYPAI|nr:glycosyltransferase family 1 protein [Trichoderma atroviride IMI 206040]EHK43614.1 glycosyltransferase family 1 protein [Trichoderma atroviride IMI 206040]
MAIQPKRVLFVTDVEPGELNVFLATAQSVRDADYTVEIHLATPPGFDDDVPAGATYHQINGLPLMQAVQDHFNSKQSGPTYPLSFIQPPGFRNTRKAIKDAAAVHMPYTGRQMVDLFASIVNIIRSVDPTLIVVNSCMAAGLTACYHLDVKFICLSPKSIKEFAALEQPRGATLWKFPALFSGFPYPVPWHKVLLNAYYVNFTTKAFKKDPQRKDVQSYLTAHTVLKTPMDLIRRRPDNVKILVASLPQLDFPLKIPAHVVACGPIIRHPVSVWVSEPDLAEWLAEGRTIYINMGTLVKMTEDQAVELAKALKIVINELDKDVKKGRIQVLWKLRKYGAYSVFLPGCRIEQVLCQAFQQDRIRVKEWIQADPLAVFRTGSVVCSIHHGGANSYNEAIVAGIPQVIIPAWSDCYDYAQRAEYLGIGLWGTRNMKNGWSARELSTKILGVIVGQFSVGVKKRCNVLKQICEFSGSGADFAALMILRECEPQLSD